MKTVAEMTEVEKAQVRSWLRSWQEVGPILEELRAREIRQADTAKAIAAFDGLFEAAVRDLPPKPTSGLIEQQRLFKRARK